MNNPKRTPGVWTVDPTYPYDINCGDDVIASVETGNEYSAGDALLIAAAPDLEDLAHAFLESMIGRKKWGEKLTDTRLDELYRMAEKAVMKAKGIEQ